MTKYPVYKDQEYTVCVKRNYKMNPKKICFV